MIKIGKRPLSEVIKRVFKKNLFKIIKNFFIVHKNPIQAMYEEFFTKGKYPKLIKTPYRRYIMNQIRNNFSLVGIPIRLSLRKK